MVRNVARSGYGMIGADLVPGDLGGDFSRGVRSYIVSYMYITGT